VAFFLSPFNYDSGMTLADTFLHWLPRIEAEMTDIVNTAWQPQPPELNAMLRYHLGFANADGSPASINAGKRIRPILVLLSCAAVGGDPDAILPAAAGVELLHNFSLIHDDIEDGDELRRGRPTLWKQWNTAQAINSGDTMFAMAYDGLQRCAKRGVAAERVLRALDVFTRTNIHLTVGQHLDLSFETRDSVSAAEYLTMITGKTGALTRASCEIGAILGSGSAAQIDALGQFGASLGRSFQLQDDVLGIWGDPSKTGKADSDLAHRKKTLPVLFAAERDERVRQLYFTGAAPTFEQISELRARIEAAGGRAHTESAAQTAYAHGLEALEALPANDATSTLEMLAKSLLGRQS
jgi:geranylgeranyl diphosphate synthase, type I